MAAKRRKIVQEDLDMGTSTSSIPTDSGGTRVGSQINPALAYNTVGYKTAAMSGGDATITTEQDLSGATVSLDRLGIWKITGIFTLTVNAATNAGRCIGYINVDGSNQTPSALLQLSTTGQTIQATITQQCYATVTANPTTAKLRAIRDTGTAIVTAHQTHTQILAEWLGVS